MKAYESRNTCYQIGKFDHIAPPVQSISLEGQIEKKRLQEGKDKRRSPFPDKKMT